MPFQWMFQRSMPGWEAPTSSLGVGLSGVVSPVVFGWLIDLTGNWNIPFATGIGVLLLGAAAVPLLRPDIPLVVPTDRSTAHDDLPGFAPGTGQLQ